jgi:tellurium resistance protein TerD
MDNQVTILPKGQSVDIKAKSQNKTKFTVGAGWDVIEGEGSYDLDLTAVLLNASGKVYKADGVVYYQHTDEPGVHHTGDNTTGEGEGDDEQIQVDLAALPADVVKVAFIVNIYEGKSKNQDFSKVNNSFVRVFETEGEKELARHDLKAEYAGKTGVLVATLSKEGNFEATAEGVDGSIIEILKAKGFAS